jgi:hypothetical protein
MTNPKVYYRLDNFYQNHRSFQKFSFPQLKGDDKKLDLCEPAKLNKNMLENPEKWDISFLFKNTKAGTELGKIGLD